MRRVPLPSLPPFLSLPVRFLLLASLSALAFAFASFL